jgi:hypothetical protein
MNKRLVTILVLLWSVMLAGCSRGSKTSLDYLDTAYRWSADLSQPGDDLLVRGEKIDQIKTDLDQLIFAVNGSDQDPESFRTPAGQEPLGTPKLKLIELQGDLVIVEVINALYLTQRMGSTGADTFLAEATFTLMEHPSVNAVFFQFEEGDHATPGLYTRENFLNHWVPVEK